LDLERIHQSDDVEGYGRLLGVPERGTRKKARGAIAAQIRDDHPVAGRGQQRRDIDKAVNVVWPAVQQNYRGTIGRAGFSVSNVEEAGVDLLSELNDVFVPGLIGGNSLGNSPGFVLLDCASAMPIVTSGAAARVMAALNKKPRRLWLIASNILILLIGEYPLFD